MLIGGQSQAVVQPVANCVVSPNIATSGLQLDGLVWPFFNLPKAYHVNSPVYVWITKDSKAIAADTNVRDLSNLVAGPALFFLDNHKRNQVLTAPLNIQALGSANLGINQFGSAISLGNSKSQVCPVALLTLGRCSIGGQLQAPGFLSQQDVNYIPEGGSQSKYDVKSKSISKSSASDKKPKGKRSKHSSQHKRRLSNRH
jgi:hypothetical protein